jgi:hypothetical protein
MGVLAEYLKTEAEQLRTELGQRKQAYEEWLESISKLYGLLKGWLRDADGGLHLITVHDGYTALVSEPRFGGYWVKKLTIELGVGGRCAEVVPRARYVIATIQPPGQEPRRADGMAQILDGNSPAYYLFRRITPAGDEWFIRSVAEWNADKDYGRVEPLDPDRFEAVVLSILQ